MSFPISARRISGKTLVEVAAAHYMSSAGYRTLCPFFILPGISRRFDENKTKLGSILAHRISTSWPMLCRRSVISDVIPSRFHPAFSFRQMSVSWAILSPTNVLALVALSSSRLVSAHGLSSGGYKMDSVTAVFSSPHHSAVLSVS